MQLLWQITQSYNTYLSTLLAQCDLLETQLKVSTENKQLYQIMDIQKLGLFQKRLPRILKRYNN